MVDIVATGSDDRRKAGLGRLPRPPHSYLHPISSPPSPCLTRLLAVLHGMPVAGFKCNNIHSMCSCVQTPAFSLPPDICNGFFSAFALSILFSLPFWGFHSCSAACAACALPAPACMHGLVLHSFPNSCMASVVPTEAFPGLPAWVCLCVPPVLPFGIIVLCSRWHFVLPYHYSFQVAFPVPKPDRDNNLPTTCRLPSFGQAGGRALNLPGLAGMLFGFPDLPPHAYSLPTYFPPFPTGVMYFCVLPQTYSGCV